ncbi:MAG TPA: coproporphyrinogen dehydrogenase HemZ [Anaerovoracaceae bacterium]|nr:coproporphyrinogen dehydrogenase HemZ [Anaerovoracaceae bacterium]
MYRINIVQVNNKYEFEELIKVFLKSGEYQLIGPAEKGHDEECIDIQVPIFSKDSADGEKKEKDIKNQIKRFLFNELQHDTGETPDWGILTGVRPVKLAGELLQREGTEEKARDILVHDYYLTQEKAQLVLDIVAYQKKLLRVSPGEAVGLYIGIPFCPTRCVYCSFPSNQGKAENIAAYLTALHREISFVAENMKQKGWYPESIYIGGGTPTTLTAEQLDELLKHMTEDFDLSHLREFTVEAGRPDTITAEKLGVIKKYSAQRISINPQSMNAPTLERIGRAHRPEDIVEAFRLAREAGIPMINTDVIAGLPEEETEDFIHTLRCVLDLAPENITVHTLALKRASRLKEIDSEFNYKQGKRVRAMLNRAKEMLSQAGYEPYYLYRQKQMTGNFENVGYARGNTAGIYNIRIMEEAQTIVALGAGGISKVYYSEGNRLERVANVSNYEIYIERLDEMLQRKEDNLFKSSKNL